MNIKHLLLALLFFLPSLSTYAQGSDKTRSHINDATVLSAHKKSQLKNKIILTTDVQQLLKPYYPNTPVEQIDTALLHRNPFFAGRFLPRGMQADNSSYITRTLSGIGNMDVTTIADGLAKFLVQRTKEELSVAFFSQLKQDMASDKYIGLRTIFPQTYHLLQTIDQNIYQFSIYLTDLRNAFNADLANIPTTLPYVVDLPDYQKYFADKPWVQRAIQTGLFVADVFTDKNKNDSLYHAGWLLEKMNADVMFPLTARNTTDTNINGSIKTLQLLSNSFRAVDTNDQYWVTGPEILKMVADSVTFKLYLGLLYQGAANNNIYFSNGMSLQRILDTVAAHNAYSDIRGSITQLTMNFNLFDAEWKTLKGIKDGSIKDSAYVYYDALFNTGIDILSSGLQLGQNFTKDAYIKVPANFWLTTDRYIAALRDASNVFMYVNQKKYSLAVTSLTSFFNNIIESNGKFKNAGRFVEKLNTYGTFMAQVSTARSSDEVDSIITRTVLPVGSSYIKKHSRFNIALNGYVGLYAGRQRQATDKDYVGVAGVYAPVGLAFSWGLPWLNIQHNPSSFTLMASIIDLGPLVSFRFSNANDTLANNINIRLNQILSPGVHAVIGLPKVPLSVGGGLNWTPLITNVEKDKIVTMPDNKPALRYELFIAVDIPLLNFHNNPR